MKNQCGTLIPSFLWWLVFINSCEVLKFWRITSLGGFARPHRRTTSSDTHDGHLKKHHVGPKRAVEWPLFSVSAANPSAGHEKNQSKHVCEDQWMTCCYVHHEDTKTDPSKTGEQTKMGPPKARALLPASHKMS